MNDKISSWYRTFSPVDAETLPAKHQSVHQCVAFICCCCGCWWWGSSLGDQLISVVDRRSAARSSDANDDDGQQRDGDRWRSSPSRFSRHGDDSTDPHVSVRPTDWQLISPVSEFSDAKFKQSTSPTDGHWWRYPSLNWLLSRCCIPVKPTTFLSRINIKHIPEF